MIAATDSARSPYLTFILACHMRVQWSPDDRQLASGGNDNQLLVWQLGQGSPVMRFTEHQVRL